MLMILFWVGNSRYALDTASVIEIIPRVDLQNIHGTRSIVAGLLNYQGTLVPVINLSQLLGGGDPKPTLSTRIILINPDPRKEPPQLLGLLAEQVTETLDSTQITSSTESVNLSDSPYLSHLLLHQQEMIQCLQVKHLLSEQEYESLLSQAGTEVGVGD